MKPHLRVALSNWLSRAGSVTAQLLALPVLTSILTTSEFATYAILISFMAWYQLTDLGFGNSTQNTISELLAQNKSSSHIIATACTLGFSILIIGMTALLPLSWILEKHFFAQATFNTSHELSKIIWLSGTLFIGNTLGIISQKILYAINKGINANIINLVNSMIYLLLLWLTIRFGDPQHYLLSCVLAYTLPMGIIGIMTLGWIAYTYAQWNWCYIKQSFITLRGRAWKFWTFALLAAATLNVDYMIMSQTLNSKDIAAYNVIFRLFWIGMALYSGLLSATWPVFSRMGIQNDINGIVRLIQNYLIVALSIIFLFAIVLLFSMPLILAWITPNLSIQISSTTILLFGVYIALRIWTDTYAAVLQALSDINIFLTIIPIQAAISITMQWVLSKHFGINGILLGLICSFVFTVAWALPLKLKLKLKLK